MCVNTPASAGSQSAFQPTPSRLRNHHAVKKAVRVAMTGVKAKLCVKWRCQRIPRRPDEDVEVGGHAREHARRGRRGQGDRLRAERDAGGDA
jgi:hypothetical protein